MSGFFVNSLKAMHKDLEEVNEILNESADEILRGMKKLIEEIE